MKAGLLHRIGKRVAALGWVAVLVVPLVIHVAIATGRFVLLAGLLSVAEVTVLAVLALRPVSGPRRVIGAVAAVIVVALLGLRLLRPGWAGPDGLVVASGLSHALIYSSILLLFGRSLQPGRTALITGLATRLRGTTLTPPMLAYTRTVTKAWCVFFSVQLAISAGLALLAPPEWWSLFVNVLDGPCVLLMFATEYAVRRWRFRGVHHISPAETVRSFARSRAAGP